MVVVYERPVGKIAHLINTILMAYFVLWIVATPYIDAGHFLQNWFPPRKELGLLLPLTLVVGFVAIALSVAGWHIWLA